MLRKIRVEDAVGLQLAHDVTKVIPGQFKGPAFCRGHVIREQDITELLSIGKEHVYVLHLESGEVHEEEAALRIARAVAGPGLKMSGPKEGRVDLIVSIPGLLKVNVKAVNKINALHDVILVTLHQNLVYREGYKVAGMRIIPLYTTEGKVSAIEEICRKAGPVFRMLPLLPGRLVS